ncbi:TetR/AcrR family transcriptional regulator [Demequina maris]|uniref:TetR/AcrR family transcriptional regulator n=1 Tax=Demequina maris TaxID=1638982 RepID=UPI0007811168|nr:TetR/AcrR family transcriptional regulator [Demequina maris]
MARPASDKRERLTAAAVRLATTRGLAATTLGAIAEEAGVPAGSVYYYFKTREDVVSAVVEALHARQRDLMASWEAEEDPRARLTACITHHVATADDLRAHGSPVAAVCAELRRSGDPRATDAADIIATLVSWVAAQFAAMGFGPEAARARATHLVTGLEGAATLAHALDDPAPLEREAAHLGRWIAQTRSP